jgi:hypothetical protein
MRKVDSPLKQGKDLKLSRASSAASAGFHTQILIRISIGCFNKCQIHTLLREISPEGKKAHFASKD